MGPTPACLTSHHPVSQQLRAQILRAPAGWADPLPGPRPQVCARHPQSPPPPWASPADPAPEFPLPLVRLSAARTKRALPQGCTPSVHASKSARSCTSCRVSSPPKATRLTLKCPGPALCCLVHCLCLGQVLVSSWALPAPSLWCVQGRAQACRPCPGGDGSRWSSWGSTLLQHKWPPKLADHPSGASPGPGASLGGQLSSLTTAHRARTRP